MKVQVEKASIFRDAIGKANTGTPRFSIELVTCETGSLAVRPAIARTKLAASLGESLKDVNVNGGSPHRSAAGDADLLSPENQLGYG